MKSRKAHIAGIGETRYARWGKIGDVTEHALALEAITRAVADAGLTVDDVDGLASFADDRNEAIYLAAELGLPALRFGNMVWMPGGGGGCAAVGNAAMAVETGQACAPSANAGAHSKRMLPFAVPMLIGTALVLATL